MRGITSRPHIGIDYVTGSRTSSEAAKGNPQRVAEIERGRKRERVCERACKEVCHYMP